MASQTDFPPSAFSNEMPDDDFVFPALPPLMPLDLRNITLALALATDPAFRPEDVLPAEPVPSEEPIQLPPPAYQPSEVSRLVLDPVQLPPPAYQPSEVPRPVLAVVNSRPPPQPVVPRTQERAVPVDLEAGQGTVEEEETFENAFFAAVIFALSLHVLFVIVWALARRTMTEVAWLALLLGMPHSVLFAVLSRPYKINPKDRRRLIKRTIAITALQSLCNIALVIFGAYLQYKWNAF